MTDMPARPFKAAHDLGPGFLLPDSRMASLMQHALFVAESNLGQTAPNPSVGAVIADLATGEIIASAATAPGGRPHAEVQALRIAGARAKGAILFTTLEPCSHFGATPPCAHSIAEAGVATVVYGSPDPDMRVAGRGLSWLESNGVQVLRGAFAKDSDWLNLGHALRVTERRPFVQIKLAVDGNGRVPVGDGRPIWVTGETARAQAHLLRAKADAILVGRKTVEADDPELTCRLAGLEERSPVRVVLAPHCNVPEKARIFKTATPPVWIVCGDSTKCGPLGVKPGVRLFDVGASPSGNLNIRLVLMRLTAEGITRLLVEGGPATARAFIDAGVADEVIIMQGEARLAPEASLLPFGADGLELISASKSFILAGQRKAGADTIRVFRSAAHWQA
jgi:diaminohydroxyphosphoribosylaminopyrimidine deaminase / 5-amino-6-(5-phosphoribosylamino)uracil reductase